jgi:hypothetical protein
VHEVRLWATRGAYLVLCTYDSSARSLLLDVTLHVVPAYYKQNRHFKTGVQPKPPLPLHWLSLLHTVGQDSSTPQHACYSCFCQSARARDSTQFVLYKTRTASPLTSDTNCGAKCSLPYLKELPSHTTSATSATATALHCRPGQQCKA